MDQDNDSIGSQTFATGGVFTHIPRQRWNNTRARSYMFSVHDPGKMFSKQVLGTRAFRLRALWNVLGTPLFRFKIGTNLGLHSMTYYLGIHCATCEVILMCTLRADSGLRAKPRPVRTCSRFLTSFRLHFGGVLRRRFVPRTRFDCVPAGTVLAGTRLCSRTRSDGVFREHVPARTVPRTYVNA